MPEQWTETIGWVATAAFAASYVAKTPGRLRLIQAGAAILWIVYGVARQATPVIAANAAVAGMALWSMMRSAKTKEING